MTARARIDKLLDALPSSELLTAERFLRFLLLEAENQAEGLEPLSREQVEGLNEAIQQADRGEVSDARAVWQRLQQRLQLPPVR